MARKDRKTGTRHSLTRAELVDTALLLGLTDFTLVGVAGKLGVAASSLYRVIASRDDLLRACLERIAMDSLADFDALTGPWEEGSQRFGQLMWQLLDETPGLAQVLMSKPWAYQAFAPAIASSSAALEAGGLPAEKAMVMVDFIADTVISTHVQVEIMREAAAAEAAAKPVPVVETISPNPEDNSQHWTELGWLQRKIGIIIDGVATRVPRSADTAESAYSASSRSASSASAYSAGSTHSGASGLSADTAHSAHSARSGGTSPSAPTP
ncbi:TetR/AcrR family transcriptional regulator [Actinomyces trachealis]|uniref:TetR/AcrR family transcriptional regulator n=1 Tax=Actinomyces trachealis TaxID=2763540 RepID=UPI00189296C6|nr:TetR/AcrR family transcriptional regulator [Actinomyces trachealis]